VLRGDAVEAARELKTRPGREVQVHGSARLANALLSAGLVDTLRLVMAPTVLGSGRRLLAHPAATAGLRLSRHEATTRGLLILEYEVTGAAAVSDYEGVTDLP
jgi:riboflavin biosynthesis pyrimidine reductase